ncbi:hypothetical protein NQ317_011714 [Molorchus minor]|uniref:Uncharacterized protein n=1 Tax=Molorchus minor TaxID=1323400 RepID=A0ABQ9J3S5_9CUCU|nr:hypothetical protein NQ317_011714 [Molorchus minor]
MNISHAPNSYPICKDQWSLPICTPTGQNIFTAIMQMIFSTCLLLFLKLLSVHGEPSVHILAENLEQLITSSTLEWIPYTGHNTVFFTRCCHSVIPID